MNGGTVFLVGAGAIASYFGYTMMNHDPMVVNLPVAQVQEQLSRATTTWQRAGNDGTGSVRPAGVAGDGVGVWLQIGPRAQITSCRIQLVAQDEETTKMVPDCGAPGRASSAMAQTQAELHEGFVREHARSVMAGEPFDRDRVQASAQVAVLRNREAMGDEALQMHDQMKAQEMLARNRGQQ